MIDSLHIGLASPEEVRQWAGGEGDGRVSNSKTVDYKSLTPVKDGLFCERIFGAAKSDRRRKLGYIELASPVVHGWYLKDRTGYLAILLGKKKKRIREVAYCQKLIAESLVPISPPPIEEGGVDPPPRRRGIKVHPHAQAETPKGGGRRGVVSYAAPPPSRGWGFKGRKGEMPSLPSLPSISVLTLVAREEGEDFPLSPPPSSFLPSLSLAPRLCFDLWSLCPFEVGDLRYMAGSKGWVDPTLKRKWTPLEASGVRHEGSQREGGGEWEPLKGKGGAHWRELKGDGWGWYSQSHAFPSLPTTTYTLYMRESVIDLLTHTPPLSDRAIPFYSAVPRSDHPVKVDELFAQQEGKLGWPTERILHHTGGGALRNLLRRVDLRLMRDNLIIDLQMLYRRISMLKGIEFPFLSEEKLLDKLEKRHTNRARRLKVVKWLLSTHRQPEWMTLSRLPVLPPDLRPILRLDNDVLVASDLNKLYQRVINRNDRLLRKASGLPGLVCAMQSLLQDGVDQLLDGGRSGSRALSHYHGRPLKSLSDILKGKRGRFRQNLLGKRVDYSGRSVIVVGPRLRLQECGLPKEMAIRLFQPFVTRQMVLHSMAGSMILAKQLLRKSDRAALDLLSEMMMDHPVLLNRAPTLHRLGVQSFQARLTEGRAILLHPLVCTAFNADFDGDQMAVHIPLSFQSRAEAWKVMWSRNHLLSPATGQPITAPTQDMVLGCYYLTSSTQAPQLGRGAQFASGEGALRAYSQGSVALHAPVWVEQDGVPETGRAPATPLEVRVDNLGKQVEVCAGYQLRISTLGGRGGSVRTTPGRLILNQAIPL